ncbi:hypothetical protein PHMEG_0001427 [Phytophthora megakarya]|uniref:Uncharacterized protein n=1 Tax=Phytophthora megakarya TaxID=4795 RepID=A0A225X0K0_9STRA|nr:hypothetical protein PHMEG_0001427 [Phytophthora megakarya]
MYNKLHQMRLGMIQTRAISLATIDTQKKLRMKFSRELKMAQEAVQKLEKMKMTTEVTSRKMTKEQRRVDSDAFDTFSKQSVDAETLLPDITAKLEQANAYIIQEQRNIKIIREYVRDFAVKKLQASIRSFLRFRKWKKVLKIFQDDAQLAAVLEIQAAWRMFTAKKQKLLLQLLYNEAKTKAACVIQHFSVKATNAKRRKENGFPMKGLHPVIATQTQKSIETLLEIFGRFVLQNALTTWKSTAYKARSRILPETSTSAILIQRIYRGFRDRNFLKRIKMRRSLTDRVGALVDQFIVSGDLWKFILEIDADYRRFMHKIEEEEADASTFITTVLRQRKHDESKMMQEWFTASALQNPLINGMDEVNKMYSNEEGNSIRSSVSQAMLQSAFVEDLVALSPNKRKDDLFPADFPPKVIRQALAKGFSLDEVIAVMRGLQAQRKDIEDADLVLMTLQKRSPLMTNPWISERVLREARNMDKTPTSSIPVVKVNHKVNKPDVKIRRNTFISENLLDSIGMNAPISRLLLVAALRCYNPSQNESGRFILSEGRNSELFQSYLSTETPLLKIRIEQQAIEAVKPFLHTLLENRCYTAYDILYNVRGIGELVSWNIPRPLAKNIYSVIEEIRNQSSHICKRNIIRDVRFSVGFGHFLKTRERKNENSIVSKLSETLGSI